MLFFATVLLIRIKLHQGNPFLNLFGLIFSIFLLFSLRYYLAVVFAFFVMFYFILSRFQLQKRTHWLLWILILLVLVFGLTESHPNLNLDRVVNVIQQNQIEFRNISDERNLLKYPFSGSGWGSLLLNLPVAVAYSFFAPFLWKVHNFLSIFAVLESLTIFFLFLWLSFSKPSLKKFPLILLLIIIGYCLTLAAGLALAAPNVGSLVRYRIVFTPFMVFLLVYFLQEKWGRSIKIFSPQGI